MLLVKCPKCGHDMKYMPIDGKLSKQKKKRCVYCGRSFMVVEQIVKQ